MIRGVGNCVFYLGELICCEISMDDMIDALPILAVVGVLRAARRG